MGERTVHDRRWWILGTLVISCTLVAVLGVAVVLRWLPGRPVTPASVAPDREQVSA